MNKLSEVRVRIAPSPTGFFHVGSARTALYSWLFAQHHNGTFILRVEDTDVARSSREMIQVILDGLTWLGLQWDEGPYFQSERLAIYNNYAQKLIKKNIAYYCYCQPEVLEKEKKEAYKNKQDWKYDRRCLRLSSAEREEKERQNIPKALRFLVPDKTVEFNDIIHGHIEKQARDIEDFIIVRHNNTPTYNFACVVDDFEMGISHVIRAVEHISNTPKQILLYEALGLDKPEFAHLPLILDKDKKKLSKRHGAVSLMSYRNQGVLAKAMVNYLSLLGWSPGDDREIMTPKQIIESFTLKRINPANAVFDVTKLEWMNGQYIMSLTDEELLEQLKPHIVKQQLMTADEVNKKSDWLLKICKLMKQRLRLLGDIGKNGGFFFSDNFEYDQDVLQKHLSQHTIEAIKKFTSILKSIQIFDAQAIEQCLREFAEKQNIKARDVIHPLRIYVTGKSGGPGLFETLEVLGKETCLRRINKIISEYGRIND